MTTLTPSQAATLRHITERPGKVATIAIGLDYAAALEAAGHITIRKGRCYPTATAESAAAPFPRRSPAQQRDDMAHAHATLIGRWAAAS